MTGNGRGGAPFALLCLLGAATFFSSYLRIPVLPLFAASLGAGPAQVGLINGGFMVTAGLLSVPAGVLVDRLGRRGPVLAGIAATAASSLLVALCHTPLQMGVAYLLFGAGLAAFAPAMLSLVADSVDPERLGQAYGWYTTAIYLAMTLGPALGGYLAGSVGLRPVFLVSGALLLLVLVFARLALSPTPPSHRTGLHEALLGSRRLMGNAPLRACLAATLGSCIGFGLFLTFLPLHAAGSGLDPTRTGLVFAAQAVTNVLGRVPIGMLGDRVERCHLVAAGLGILAAALAALGQAGGFGAMAACAVGLGVGMALIYTAVGAIIAGSVPPAQRGLAMGMYNSCIYLGMMAGSTAMGMAVKALGYPAVFAAAGGIALVTGILFLRLLGPAACRRP
jgi:MFS family permease